MTQLDTSFHHSGQTPWAYLIVSSSCRACCWKPLLERSLQWTTVDRHAVPKTREYLGPPYSYWRQRNQLLFEVARAAIQAPLGPMTKSAARVHNEYHECRGSK